MLLGLNLEIDLILVPFTAVLFPRSIDNNSEPFVIKLESSTEAISFLNGYQYHGIIPQDSALAELLFVLLAE